MPYPTIRLGPSCENAITPTRVDVSLCLKHVHIRLHIGPQIVEFALLLLVSFHTLTNLIFFKFRRTVFFSF